MSWSPSLTRSPQEPHLTDEPHFADGTSEPRVPGPQPVSAWPSQGLLGQTGPPGGLNPGLSPELGTFALRKVGSRSEESPLSLEVGLARQPWPWAGYPAV